MLLEILINFHRGGLELGFGIRVVFIELLLLWRRGKSLLLGLFVLLRALYVAIFQFWFLKDPWNRKVN